MSTFRHGAPVAFPLGRAHHIGTIERPESIGGASGYLVNGPDAKPGPWLVFAEDIIPIPDGAPVLTDGTRVQVAPDAPGYANRVGYVHEPAVRDGMFGYWLHLAWPEETVWVPAQALAVLEPDGGPR